MLPALFFCSGVSSLIFETVFTRLLSYTFGNTAYAVSTVLAAFLGGLALGAFVLGCIADRRSPSAALYGYLELLVGIYALFIPGLFALLTSVYVGLYHAYHFGSTTLTGTQFVLSGMVIVIPTFLMGGTLPVLARFVAAHCRNFQSEVSRLYAWNTFGAAAGTLAAAYFLIPTFGLWGAILTAAGINLSLFVSVVTLERFSQRSALSLSILGEPPAEESTLQSITFPDCSPRLLGLGAFLTGAVGLAYEVIWTHVLSFLIGNTVYAFGAVLFTLLCGLGWGARFVARRVQQPEKWPAALAVSQLALGLAVLLTLPLWNHIPDFFSGGLPQVMEMDAIALSFLIVCRMAFAGWTIYNRPSMKPFPWTRTVELAVEVALILGVLNANSSNIVKYESTYFYAGELFRFLLAFGLLIIPSILLGMSFPLFLNLSSGAARRAGKSVGSIYAANTVGAILGSVVTGFVVLPWAGSFVALRVAGAANFFLGLWFAIQWVPLTSARKLLLALATSGLIAIGWFGQRFWDARNMTRGSYVYFTPGWPIDRVLYFKEDVEGGLTSVIQMGPTRVLLSNGKFQGNDTGEVGGQIRFATIPVLFSHSFDRALVIGLGTGNTLRAVSRFPFRQIDAVELVPSIVEAARQWFGDINGHVFDTDPRVKLAIADGRNFLLLSRDHYDLVTIEVSSIWISGEADLYNKEFYQLCRDHLTEHGVLQQWVQIHHMRTQDLLVILNTARQIFPHTAFFLGPEQGLLIASPAPLTIDPHQILAFDSDSGVKKELDMLGIPSMAALMGELVLYGDSMQRALLTLPKISELPGDFASTDFRPYLEYQTPKGNALPYDSVAANTSFLMNFRPPPIPTDLAFRNDPTDDEKNLFAAYTMEARGDMAASLELLRRVHGPDLLKAQAEIARIESRFQQNPR